MAPVNVSASQNRSQRQASHSQSSRLSGRTGQDSNMQVINLNMPGIAEFSSNKNEKSQSRQTQQQSSNSNKNQQSKLISNTLTMEPRLASADKKNSFEMGRINRILPHQHNKNASSSQVRIEPVRPSGGFGTFNRDRFVAHRRIDLICDDTTESNSTGGNPGKSLSMSMQKDRSLRSAKNSNSYQGQKQQYQFRNKSESVLSATESIPVAQKLNVASPQSKTTLAACANSLSSHQNQPAGKPGSAGRRNMNTFGAAVSSVVQTRNSKSSFGSNSRLQKQSVAKDWVICLPNEPPQVIETQPANDEMLVEQDSGKRQSTIEAAPAARTKHQAKKESYGIQSQTEAQLSSSSRGGKSLLHPAAQKKVRATQALAASGSFKEVNLESQKRGLPSQRATVIHKTNKLSTVMTSMSNSTTKKSILQANNRQGILPAQMSKVQSKPDNGPFVPVQVVRQNTDMVDQSREQAFVSSRVSASSQLAVALQASKSKNEKERQD